jgi:hypothetical protein
MELSSREYKFMLKPELFAGDAEACRAKVASFWKAANGILHDSGIATSGKLSAKPDKQRQILFLDTDGLDLYKKSDLVFRLRRKLGSDGPWQATLKFRHGDRLMGEAQEFRLHDGGDLDEDETFGKFEEDIKAVVSGRTPRFWALFSRSVNADFDAVPKTIGACLKAYDRAPIMTLPLKTPVSQVKDLMITEHLFEGASLVLSGNVEAECGLILWWKEQSPQAPLAVEFSFRFKLKNVKAQDEAVRKAWDAMTALCLSENWAFPDGPTKTAIVYGDAEV